LWLEDALLDEILVFKKEDTHHWKKIYPGLCTSMRDQLLYPIMLCVMKRKKRRKCHFSLGKKKIPNNSEKYSSTGQVLSLFLN
jgi:hypothetical protein